MLSEHESDFVSLSDERSSLYSIVYVGQSICLVADLICVHFNVNVTLLTFTDRTVQFAMLTCFVLSLLYSIYIYIFVLRVSYSIICLL